MPSSTPLQPAVGSGRSSALCPHHRAALRSGEPAAARHAQGAQRGRGAPQPRQDRRSAGAGLAAEPSGLLLSRRCWASRGCSTSTPRSSRYTGSRRVPNVGYNPHKPGRPSHCYHTYMLSSLRLVLQCGCAARRPAQRSHATDGSVVVAGPLGPAAVGRRCCAVTSPGASSR